MAEVRLSGIYVEVASPEVDGNYGARLSGVYVEVATPEVKGNYGVRLTGLLVDVVSQIGLAPLLEPSTNRFFGHVLGAAAALPEFINAGSLYEPTVGRGLAVEFVASVAGLYGAEVQVEVRVPFVSAGGSLQAVVLGRGLHSAGIGPGSVAYAPQVTVEVAVPRLQNMSVFYRHHVHVKLVDWTPQRQTQMDTSVGPKVLWKVLNEVCALWPVYAPYGTKVPYVVYAVQRAAPVQGLNGYGALTNTTFTLRIFHTKRKAAMELVQVLVQRLEASRELRLGEYRFGETEWEHETREYMVPVMVSIWHG